MANMQPTDNQFDHGKPFNWGKAASDYAKYRDIYPPIYYEKLLAMNLCTAGQQVLDVGTGTGVLPRNLVQHGANFTAVDPSPEQIAQAVRLSEGLPIRYAVASAETADFPPCSFDCITAAQCYFYFQQEIAMPRLASFLKPNGRLVLLYMAWLPEEDAIAKASEEIVLRHNPAWTGAGETRHPILAPACADAYFTVTHSECYDVAVPFTRESWNGRMKACRGVAPSLTPQQVAAWEADHMAMLTHNAPPSFSITHYVAMLVLAVKS